MNIFGGVSINDTLTRALHEWVGIFQKKIHSLSLLTRNHLTYSNSGMFTQYLTLTIQESEKTWETEL